MKYDMEAVDEIESLEQAKGVIKMMLEKYRIHCRQETMYPINIMENNQIINEIIKIYPNFVRGRLEELDNEFLEGILYEDHSKILPYVSSYNNFIRGLQLTDEQIECMAKDIFYSGVIDNSYNDIKYLPKDQFIDIYDHLEDDEVKTIPLSEKKIQDMYNLFCSKFEQVANERKFVNFGMITAINYAKCCNLVANDLLLNKPKFDYVYSYYKDVSNVYDKAVVNTIVYVIEDNKIKLIENDEFDKYSESNDLCCGGHINDYLECDVHDVFFKN